MNFALILFLATLVTGAVALADRSGLRAAAAPPGEPEPWWIEYPKSFFPVLLIVFLLRSFVAEPFKIPSSSMRPTLEVGDFILVNKFTYGIRLPIVEQKIVPVGDPQRGDVVVFRYPVNPSQDFIKRVDRRRRRRGRLPRQAAHRQRRCRGRSSATAPTATSRVCASRRPSASGRRSPAGQPRATTDRGRRRAHPAVSAGGVRPFPGRENCDYNERGFVCRVPAGQYLMMGDNRDNSDDSRYWGFVPDDHIRGRAFFVWFNWDDITSLAFKRVGSGIR